MNPARSPDIRAPRSLRWLPDGTNPTLGCPIPQMEPFCVQLARLPASVRDLLVAVYVLTALSVLAQPWSWTWVGTPASQESIIADSTRAVVPAPVLHAHPGQEATRTCANGEPGPCDSNELSDHAKATSPEPQPSSSVFLPAAARVDPVSGDPAKRARAEHRCTCAALDPACGCLPTATPCIGADADAGMPCRYF